MARFKSPFDDDDWPWQRPNRGRSWTAWNPPLIGVNLMPNKITEYTEEEFICLLQEIFTSNRNGTPEAMLADMLDNFCELAEHPADTDLIYWPEDDAQCTPEGITATVKEWRAANGLPGFKP